MKDDRVRPALDAYLARVGAVERNFRRHVIEVDDAAAYMRGKRQIARIEIEPDGDVNCDIEAYEPTDDERKAIKAEVAADPFPRSINARLGQLPPDPKGVDPKAIFVFRDQFVSDEITFIQQRTMHNGMKADLPWSFWSDGQWRMMEPDGLLPLFNLHLLRDAYRVYVHEGAKGAAHLQAMVEANGPELAAHPWREALKSGVHLGWPGGAPNPTRVDWGPIKRLAPHIKVVLVADNDQVGKEAITAISAILQRELTAVVFDDRFDPGHDMDDPWPQRADWWKDKIYVGPTIDDCTVPATWATKVVVKTKERKTKERETKERGRPSFKIRDEFSREWLWTSDQLFVHRAQTHKILSEANFNRTVRPFSNVGETAKLLAQKISSRVDGVIYDPGHQPGVISRDGERLINSYRPPTIKPVKRDVRPFLRFLLHLIPGRNDRREVMRWCATLIAKPATRMLYGMLLISEVQGVGKSTLGERVLAPLVGPWNVSVPSESDIVGSSFNDWIVHKRLAVVHEIYAGHSWKAYDTLKSVMTDQRIRVSKKYVPGYEVDVWLHIFACSNSVKALKLDDNDRRWLVPRVTNETKDRKYWDSLNRWLTDEDGLAIIRWWADDFLTKHEPVHQGEHAPKSGMKDDLVAEGRSEGEQMAYDLGTLAKASKKQIVLAVEEVRDWVASNRKIDRNDSRMERSLALRKALLAAKLQEPIHKEGRQRRFTVEPARMSHIVANFTIEPGTDWPDIKKFHKKPEDVKNDEEPM